MMKAEQCWIYGRTDEWHKVRGYPFRVTVGGVDTRMFVHRPLHAPAGARWWVPSCGWTGTFVGECIGDTRAECAKKIRKLFRRLGWIKLTEAILLSPKGFAPDVTADEIESLYERRFEGVWRE